MLYYGHLLYTDKDRWLLDNGTVLTEIQFCPRWWLLWRIRRHQGGERQIILGCVARQQATPYAVPRGVGRLPVYEVRPRRRSLPVPTLPRGDSRP